MGFKAFEPRRQADIVGGTVSVLADVETAQVGP